MVKDMGIVIMDERLIGTHVLYQMEQFSVTMSNPQLLQTSETTPLSTFCIPFISA